KVSSMWRTFAGVSTAKASSTWKEPINTGGVDCRDRPFAANKTATAWGLNASAPTPYTVSVGNTINSRCPRASTAAVMAALRCSDCCASNCCVTLVIVLGLGWFLRLIGPSTMGSLFGIVQFALDPEVGFTFATLPLAAY